MTSKERITAALKREDVDYVPCAPVWWSQGREGFEWAKGSREKYLLDSLPRNLNFHKERAILPLEQILNLS